jgi:hypothetical protein
MPLPTLVLNDVESGNLFKPDSNEVLGVQKCSIQRQHSITQKRKRKRAGDTPDRSRKLGGTNLAPASLLPTQRSLSIWRRNSWDGSSLRWSYPPKPHSATSSGDKLEFGHRLALATPCQTLPQRQPGTVARWKRTDTLAERVQQEACPPSEQTS